MESRHPSLQPVCPSKCALGIAIPLTRERFLADLAQPREKDFVRHFRAARHLQGASPEFYWTEYEPEAVIVRTVCSEAERRGVTVRYDLDLPGLNALLKQFPVVTLLAHWRFVPVEPEDILDAPRLLEPLRSPATEAVRAVRHAFERLDPQLLDPLIAAQLSGNELRRRVAKAVGTVTHEAERRYWDVEVGSRFNPEQMADGWRDRLTRWEFEQAFPHCLASGRVIEFSDGMRTIPELIDAIPQNFSGLLDLTVCNSVVPAGAIRTRRPNCLIAANRRPAELRSRIYLYGLEIRLLAKRPIPFTEAIKQVHSGRSTYQVKDENIWTLLRKLFGSTT